MDPLAGVWMLNYGGPAVNSSSSGAPCPPAGCGVNGVSLRGCPTQSHDLVCDVSQQLASLPDSGSLAVPCAEHQFGFLDEWCHRCHQPQGPQQSHISHGGMTRGPKRIRPCGCDVPRGTPDRRPDRGAGCCSGGCSLTKGRRPGVRMARLLQQARVIDRGLDLAGTPEIGRTHPPTLFRVEHRPGILQGAARGAGHGFSPAGADASQEVATSVQGWMTRGVLSVRRRPGSLLPARVFHVEH